MGNIWEVVSALADALQDARNQLVNLMHTSPTRLSPMRPMRLSGGQCDSYYCACSSRSITPSRAYSPFVRNVHREHAHGHVAFGLNSEYPVHATPKRVRPREIHAEMSAQRCTTPVPKGRPCTHPLHGIGIKTRNLTPRRVPQRWSSGGVKGCRSLSHTEEFSRPRNRACVNFSPSKTHGSSNASRNSSPERRHRCMATQFASLLTHEAHQQRERRLAEELRGSRPSWNRS